MVEVKIPVFVHAKQASTSSQTISLLDSHNNLFVYLTVFEGSQDKDSKREPRVEIGAGPSFEVPFSLPTLGL